MITGEVIFFPILFLIVLLCCYVSSSIIINKLGNDGFSPRDQYYNLQSNNEDSYISMPAAWLNNVVYIQLDAVSFSSNQTYLIDLIDPNTVPEGSKVTIFNNVASSTDPTNNVVQLNFVMSPPCPSRYVFDNNNPQYTCAFCPDGTVYKTGFALCQIDPGGGDSEYAPSFTDPLFINVTLGAGQGVTLITHRYIPYTGFINSPSGGITFDLTPPEFQLRTWKLFQYLQPTCSKTMFCSTNNNLPTGCSDTNICPTQYNLQPTAAPNSGDPDVATQFCTFQKCNCPTGSFLPFCIV